jgi:hypothetical protein
MKPRQPPTLGWCQIRQAMRLADEDGHAMISILIEEQSYCACPRIEMHWRFTPNYASYADLLGDGRFRMPCSGS